MKGALRRPLAAILFRLAALLLCARAAGAGESVEKVLRTASTHRHRNQHDDALRLCEEVVRRDDASEARKIEAFEIMVDVHRRRRNLDDALAAAKRLRSTLRGSKEAGKRSLFMQADIHRDSGRMAQALARLREFVRLYPDDKKACASARLGMAELLLRSRRFPEAHLEAAAVPGLAPDDDASVASALRYMQEAAWQNGEIEKCASALRRLVESRYLKRRNTRQHGQYGMRLGDCLIRLGRVDEAREHYASLAGEDDDPGRRHEWVMAAAKTFADEGRWDDALKAYELVFIAHSGAFDRWHDAQRAIVDIFLEKGETAEALRAARICLDAAPDQRWIRESVRLVAGIMAELDGRVDRANAFLDFQRYGPAGKDGKLGTADDVEDPLRDVGYPSYPERERAFADAREKVGDDALASRHRGLTYIYTGHPAMAFAFFLDGFRRATSDRFRDAAYAMLATGARAARGHAAGLESFFEFVAYGPAGPDGEAGTVDDLADPLAPLATAGETARLRGKAARAGHSQEDVKALVEARDYLMGVVRDPGVHRDARKNAARALDRVREALGAWGAEGLGAFVTGLMLKERDEWTQECLAKGAQAAARGDAYHFGGVRAFWRTVDSGGPEAGQKLMGAAGRVRSGFLRFIGDLARARSYAPEEKHLRSLDESRKRRQSSRPRPRSAPETRKADTTPPGAPSGLEAKSVGYTRAEIAWQEAEDTESGVAFYIVYRNGEEAGATSRASFTDSGLDEQTRYVYEVSATNKIGMESPKGRAVAVTTAKDDAPPRIASVYTPSRDADAVVVVFTEPVEKATAERAANYAIDRGVVVRSASLREDGKAVTLTTSKLSKGVAYTLMVANVRDRAKSPNTVAAGTRAPFEFIETGDGLSAAYYAGRDFKGRKMTRVDKCINFQWRGGSPVKGFRPDGFNVRWTGKICPEHSEEYTFIARTDDGVRLWIDGRKIIDEWRDKGAEDIAVKIRLEAGKLYDIKMEYYENSGEAAAELFWQSKSTPRRIVPQECLYTQ